MKKISLIMILTHIFIGLLTNLALAANNPGNEKSSIEQPQPTYIKHIVMVTMEGLNSKAISTGHTPNISSIAGIGVKTAAISVLPSNLSAFNASLLTGTEPAIHGYVNSGQQLKTKTFPEILLGYGRSVSLIGGETLIQADLYKKMKGISTHLLKSRDPKATIDKAIDMFIKDQPYYTGIYLSAAGDKNDQNSFQNVSSADRALGEFINTLTQYGVLEQTLFIIVGKPMETNFKDIGAGKMDTLAPVVMAGPGLKVSATIPSIKLIDIVPTAAMLAGLQMSPECSGMILWNALRSGTGYLEENLLLKRVKDLSDDSVMKSAEIYQMAEEKRLLKLEQQKVAQEKSSIQKTIEEKDGAISSLKLQIAGLKVGIVIIVSMMALGYGVEYVYLRKKFLMF